MNPTATKYNRLLNNIGLAIEQARQNAFKAVNTGLIKANWVIGKRNILDMQRFNLAYQKWQAVPAKLSWTHFVTLLGISDDTARKFYEKQATSKYQLYLPDKKQLQKQVKTILEGK